MEVDIDRIWEDLTWIEAEPRYAGTNRLEECRQYCERQLVDAGWEVSRQKFTASSCMSQSLDGVNLVSHHTNALTGAAESGRPTFILGAHLDSRENTPGADDNASAVATLLEIARQMSPGFNAAPPASEVDIELVIFDLEEHGMLGGAFHAASCIAQNRTIHGMVSLEMLGYCSHKPGSQSFPPELADHYPNTGNFIGVVGNQISGQLITQFGNGFSAVTDLPWESLQVPDNGRGLEATRLSDHSPYWDEGYPALMITDTSFLRNPHYHLPSDTIDTLDREFLHKVANGVLHAVHQITAGAVKG